MWALFSLWNTQWESVLNISLLIGTVNQVIGVVDYQSQDLSIIWHVALPRLFLAPSWYSLAHFTLWNTQWERWSVTADGVGCPGSSNSKRLSWCPKTDPDKKGQLIWIGRRSVELIGIESGFEEALIWCHRAPPCGPHQFHFHLVIFRGWWRRW